MTRIVLRGGRVFDGTGADPAGTAERVEQVWKDGVRAV